MSKVTTESSTIANLKFYALLKPREKIEKSEPLSVANDTYFNSLRRTFSYTGNRYSNLEDITNTINDSFKFLDEYMKDKQKHKLKIQFLLTDINKLLNEGLMNLKQTYINDRMFVCKIESIIESIKLNLFERNISQDTEDQSQSPPKSDPISIPTPTVKKKKTYAEAVSPILTSLVPDTLKKKEETIKPTPLL